MTGGAAAQAAGVMGGANAWSGALQGVGNVANQVGRYYQQKNLLNQWMNGGDGNGGWFYGPGDFLSGG